MSKFVYVKILLSLRGFLYKQKMLSFVNKKFSMLSILNIRQINFRKIMKSGLAILLQKVSKRNEPGERERAWLGETIVKYSDKIHVLFCTKFRTTSLIIEINFWSDGTKGERNTMSEILQPKWELNRDTRTETPFLFG